MPPSKDDFEQLIEQCSQIKFSGVEINFDALESCLEESVQNFIDERQEMFRGFEKLSAYNWLTKTNGVSFNRANKRLGIPTFGFVA